MLSRPTRTVDTICGPRLRLWLCAMLSAAALNGTAQAQQRAPVGAARSQAVAQGIRMPDLRGMTEAEARARLAPLRPQIQVIDRDTNVATLADRVAGQRPDSGTPVRAGVAVALLVYRYAVPATVRVPYVVGTAVPLAAIRLSRRGLTPKLPTISAAELAGGIVDGQKPDSGTQVPRGSEVALSVRPSSVAVPNVVGMEQVRAERAIQAEQLRVGRITREYSELYPPGVVAEQTPPAPTSVSVGRPIDLVVSLGPHPSAPEVTIPSLHGLTPREARDSLLTLKLSLGQVSQQDDASSIGRVITQRPQPQSTAHVGDSVHVVVGRAPPRPSVRVPAVVGLARDVAERTVRDSGLSPLTVVSPTDSERVARVITQQPSAGTPVPIGSRVTLEVTQLARRVTQTMPNVMDLTEDAARQELAFVMAPIAVAWTPAATARQHGRVLSQEPGAGAPVVADQVIRLQLGRYTAPPFVVVPNVTGLALRRAVDTLRGARLDPIAPQLPGAAAAAAVVSSQRPVSGDSVQEHTAVILTVRGPPTPPPPPVRTIVPALVGRVYRDAKVLIDRAHLTLASVAGADTSEGIIVTGQSLPAGTDVVVDSPIDLVLAQPLDALVPDLTGLTLRDAVVIVDAARLQLGVEAAASGDSSATIASQTPQPNTLALAGSQVLVLLAQPPPRPSWGWIAAILAALSLAAVAGWSVIKPKPPVQPSVRLTTPDGLTAPVVETGEDSLVRYDVALAPQRPEHTMQYEGDVIAKEEEIRDA